MMYLAWVRHIFLESSFMDFFLFQFEICNTRTDVSMYDIIRTIIIDFQPLFHHSTTTIIDSPWFSKTFIAGSITAHNLKLYYKYIHHLSSWISLPIRTIRRNSFPPMKMNFPYDFSFYANRSYNFQSEMVRNLDIVCLRLAHLKKFNV